nr:hypothetical protein A6C57_18625 [Fibrella sp. ES10-3-2-2]
MCITPPQVPIPESAANSCLTVFDIVSNPNELIKLRSALRSWFMSYMTQTDGHLNHSSLAEHIWFYEAIQEWLDKPTITTSKPRK